MRSNSQVVLVLDKRRGHLIYSFNRRDGGEYG